MRAMSAFIAQLRDRADAEGMPLATTLWWGGARSAIQVRFAAQDGQTLNRADYPALWAMVSAGGYPLVADSEWLAAPLKRGSFSSGNGSTTFRMPDLNGKQANSIGAVTTRGDGASSAGAAGLLQNSQNQAHTHGLTIEAAGAHTHTVNDPGHSHSDGAFQGAPGVEYASQGGNPYFGGLRQTGGAATGIWLSAAGHHGHSGSIASSGGDEARMKSATGCFVMRVK